MTCSTLNTLLYSWYTLEGQPLRLRRGGLDDVDLLLEFETKLSPGTKYFRFGRFRNFRSTREQLQAILDPDCDTNLDLIVTAPGPDREEILASGRLILPEQAHVSELMLVVRDDWHGTGLGSRLIQALCDEATSRGVSLIYCQVLPTNRAMQAFMRRCGFSSVPNPNSDLLLRYEKPLGLQPQSN